MSRSLIFLPVRSLGSLTQLLPSTLLTVGSTWDIWLFFHSGGMKRKPQKEEKREEGRERKEKKKKKKEREEKERRQEKGREHKEHNGTTSTT